jgi:hypothetical protein
VDSGEAFRVSRWEVCIDVNALLCHIPHLVRQALKTSNNYQID